MNTIPVVTTVPEPAAPFVECFACCGRGLEHVVGSRGQWLTLPCPCCQGQGQVEASDDEPDGDDSEHSHPYDFHPAIVVAVACPECRGSGQSWNDIGADWPVKSVCYTCRGVGSIRTAA